MFISGLSRKKNADQELDCEQPEQLCHWYGIVPCRAVWPIYSPSVALTNCCFMQNKRKMTYYTATGVPTCSHTHHVMEKREIAVKYLKEVQTSSSWSSLKGWNDWCCLHRSSCPGKKFCLIILFQISFSVVEGAIESSDFQALFALQRNSRRKKTGCSR